MDTVKLPDRQKRMRQKAMKHLTEARDILYCCESPFSHPADQTKVGQMFTQFVMKLKAIR